jgi:hypothetical protein
VFCCVRRGLASGRYLVQGDLKIIQKIGKRETLECIGLQTRKRRIREKEREKKEDDKEQEG